MVRNPLASAGAVRDVGSKEGLEEPLEGEMATHRSILARGIPWTEEPGGLLGHGVAKARTRPRV